MAGTIAFSSAMVRGTGLADVIGSSDARQAAMDLAGGSGANSTSGHDRTSNFSDGPQYDMSRFRIWRISGRYFILILCETGGQHVSTSYREGLETTHAKSRLHSGVGARGWPCSRRGDESHVCPSRRLRQSANSANRSQCKQAQRRCVAAFELLAICNPQGWVQICTTFSLLLSPIVVALAMSLSSVSLIVNVLRPRTLRLL